MKKDNIYNICVWTVIIDQIVKLFISMKMKLNEVVTIIPNFFRLYYVKNDGAAFSSFSGKKYLLILVGIIFFFILSTYIKKNKIKDKLEIISLGMIMGGLVSNLIDRIMYGAVIDYLSFIILGYHFAIFNIADTLIVIGFILLVVYGIRDEVSKRKTLTVTKKRFRPRASARKLL